MGNNENEEKEELVWSSSANSKCVVFAGLLVAGIIGLAAVILGAVFAFYGYWAALIIDSLFAGIIAVIIISVAASKRLRGDLLVTNKYLRYRMGRLYFYYSFDELYEVTEYRTLADFLGETSSLKIKCLITWSMPDGRVVRQAVGFAKLPALYDAKGGKEALERAMAEVKAAKEKTKAQASERVQPFGDI